MMKFDPVPCPPTFEEKCRKRGLAWLAENPGEKRPRDFWSPFRTTLQEGFRDLCAYSCMHIPDGTVDHYLSFKTHPQHAYDWDNYRFAAQWINSSKQTLNEAVLDPFQVEDGWFEIILPSLQLVMTDAIPQQYRVRAELMLTRLHLRDDERIIKQRRKWYGLYQAGRLDLEGLRELAPLIARAVEKQMEQERKQRQAEQEQQQQGQKPPSPRGSE